MAGIAGPGDTLATDKALETFKLIHQEAISLSTILCSLMAANNEFGTIQALKEVGDN